MKRIFFVFLSLVVLITAIVALKYQNPSSAVQPSNDDELVQPQTEHKSNPESPLRARAAARKEADTAVDPNNLARISREIRVEPEYEGDTRHYYLLVFDEDEDKKVWLVFDGKNLYVDCNLNGDLSDAGETFPASKDDQGELFRKIKDISFEMPDGERASLAFTFLGAKFKHFDFGFQVQVHYRKASFGAWGDHDGALLGANSASEAPILLINGPLQMGFEVCAKHGVKAIENNQFEVKAGVGTPGLGKGSFVHLRYSHTIPEGLYPDVELEFPAERNGSPPVVVKSKLTQRC